MIQEIPIKDIFAKGMVDGAGRNKVATNFASYIRNARIDNGSIRVRSGHQMKIESELGSTVQGIIGNETNDKLLVVTNGKLYSLSTTTRTYTEIGSIGTTGMVEMFTHGKYTIILTGVTKPYVYDGTTLTLTTSTAPDVNPIIGTPFSGFTVLAGNTADTENVLYISRPITPANPERAYDRVGTNSEQINAQSKILGLIASLNSMFVWTEKTIQYMDKNSISTIGGTASLYLNIIGEGDQLLNSNVMVTAGDKVFYLTKDLSIKTLNYVPGTIDPAIGELSDRKMMNIRRFLDEDLATDQSKAFAFRVENEVRRYLRSNKSAFNDIILIYDLINDARLVDSNKFYSCMTKYNGLIYAGSNLNSSVFQNNIGYDDDGDPIAFEWVSMPFNMGNTGRLKFFKGRQVAGEMNILTKLKFETIVDGKTVASNILDGSLYAGGKGIDLGIGSHEIGGEEMGDDTENTGKFPFELVIDHTQVNLKGKNIQLRITASELGQDFYLDTLSFFIKPVGRFEKSDKL